MWYLSDVLCVRVNCFVVRGCAVFRKYINVCNSDVFSFIDMYLEYLKFCVVCINGRRYVCCSECYAVYNGCDEPTPCLVQPIVVVVRLAVHVHLNLGLSPRQRPSVCSIDLTLSLWLGGPGKRGVMSQSAQALRLASFLILLLYEPRSPQYLDLS